MPKYLYKIVPQSFWRKSEEKDSLELPPSDQQFIHLAEQHDVDRIKNKFFADEEVVVLKLDPNKLSGELIKERNPGGENEYFHLYNGAIPKISIVEVLPK